MLTLEGESSFSERGTESKSLKGRSDKGAEGTIPSLGVRQPKDGEGMESPSIFRPEHPVFFIALLLTACFSSLDSPIQVRSYLLLQPAYQRKNTSASKHNNTPLISIAVTSFRCGAGHSSQKSSSLKLRNGVPKIAGTEQKTNSKTVISSRLGKK